MAGGGVNGSQCVTAAPLGQKRGSSAELGSQRPVRRCELAAGSVWRLTCPSLSLLISLAPPPLPRPPLLLGPKVKTLSNNASENIEGPGTGAFHAPTETKYGKRLKVTHFFKLSTKWGISDQKDVVPTVPETVVL